jgi:hypothetical protein
MPTLKVVGEPIGVPLDPVNGVAFGAHPRTTTTDEMRIEVRNMRANFTEIFP